MQLFLFLILFHAILSTPIIKVPPQDKEKHIKKQTAKTYPSTRICNFGSPSTLLFSCQQNPSLLQIVSLCLPKNIPFCFRSLIWSNLPVAVSARVALCNTALLHFKQATCCCCQWCQYMKPSTTMLNIWVMSQSWKYGGWETPWSDEKLKGAVNQWSGMTILQIVIKLVMPTKKLLCRFYW